MIPEARSTDNNAVRTLYAQIIDAWNWQNTDDYAGCFAEDANLIGFDGSVVNGRADILQHLSAIFTDHETARYITKIREVRFLGPDCALLRAVAGMIPPGESDINPEVNAVQSLVAVRGDNTWLAALFHSTPAQFHGRPELAQALTDELREIL